MSELARIIEQYPEIAARLIGMANAAYFGWPGGVWTIHDAIYKVLGIKLVKSLVIGMVMGNAFDVKKCRGSRPERYRFTAVVTAPLAQGLFPCLPQVMRYQLENVHMDGLLHNLGIAVLAHLFPLELSHAFAGLPGKEVRPDIKVLFTNGYTGDVLDGEGELGKDFDFVAKPVPPGELLAKVREVLDRPSAC